MSRYFKSKKKKILQGIVITILVIGTLIGIGFILDATLPVAHNFFIKVGDWFKELFTKSNSVEPETPVAQISRFLTRR